MCKDLTNLGYHQNKTFTLKFPCENIQKEFLSAFFVAILKEMDGLVKIKIM